MLSKSYLHFLLLLLITQKKKHLAIFFISTFIVALLASTLFISSSIEKDLYATLDEQAEFIVQKYEGGKVLNAPQSWVDEFSKIKGVNNSVGRVYGMYFYEPSETYFMIVGVDFFDKEVVDSLQEVVDSVDAQKFLSKNHMIVGAGVQKLFDKYEYRGNYNFRPPDRSIEKVYIYDVFPKESAIVTNDMIIMDRDLAKKILGVEEGYVTDIALEVKNPLEIEMIRTKLIISHFNLRIIEKEDIKRAYKNLYNYKGGVFLILYITSLLTFLLILYQRYSMVTRVDAKEIAILRLVGWKINDIIIFKVLENFLIAFGAYLLGVVLAYIYVYGFDAPVLREIFLGFNNLTHSVSFTPSINRGALAVLFLIYVIPFILAILIPVWRVSITESAEVLR